MQRSGIRGGGNGITRLCRIANDIPGFRLRLHPGYLIGSPLLRQLTGGGGGEDGLAEAFEDGGDTVEAVAAGIHPRQHRVEFVGDALLFGEWGEWNINAK